MVRDRCKGAPTWGAFPWGGGQCEAGARSAGPSGMAQFQWWAVLIGLALATGDFPAGAVPAAGFRAVVVSVGDGDTLRVSRAGQPLTIRLACIDAPETAQSPWGERSRAYLRQRLPPGREVAILPHTIDRYGRTVAEVISDININLVMVEDGQAFAYRRYLGGCDAKEYLGAEFRASRHHYGVWGVEGGITRPWQFRRGAAGHRI
jgi:endonuclease YncB( thermonuclease family)